MSCAPGSGDDHLAIDSLVEQPPEAEHRQRWDQIEEHKQSCMAQEGFEYIRHVQPRFKVNSSEGRLRGALITGGDRERVEAYGYGLTAGVMESNEWYTSNPNNEIQRALDPGESDAYTEAFDRCAIEAQQESGIDVNEIYVDLSAQVTQLIGDLEAATVSDPRLDEATERWAECMSERGHRYRRLSDPRDAIMRQLSSLKPDEQEDAVRLYENLLAEEVALAVDDLDCREESGVDDVLPKVVQEADADFIDRHRDLLEEYYAIRTGS